LFVARDNRRFLNRACSFLFTQRTVIAVEFLLEATRCPG
jgi:hypothetical protein